jgi:hypothetical protein
MNLAKLASFLSHLKMLWFFRIFPSHPAQTFVKSSPVQIGHVCGCGGIGRRTWFRSKRLWRGGSSPFTRTITLKQFVVIPLILIIEDLPMSHIQYTICRSGTYYYNRRVLSFPSIDF